MNPTPTRIEDIFALNDPNHYYWDNLAKFMMGNSYKAREELFKHPFKPELKALLLAMTKGVTAQRWYSCSEDSRNFHTMRHLRIDNNVHSQTGELYSLTQEKFDVLDLLWPTLSVRQKQELWIGAWSNSTRADEVGGAFMHKCIQEWTASSLEEQLAKASMLAHTLVEFAQTSIELGRYNNLAPQVPYYKDALSKELTALTGNWPISAESVDTWMLLECLPQCLTRERVPHLWMQSLCAARRIDRDPLAFSRPDVYQFETNSAGRVSLSHMEQARTANPLNPLDHLLAQALYSMGKTDPVVAPEVQGVFGFLQGAGTENLLGAVLLLENPNQTYPEVDSCLFISPV